MREREAGGLREGDRCGGVSEWGWERETWRKGFLSSIGVIAQWLEHPSSK